MSNLVFFLFCLEGALLSFNVAASAALVPSIAKEFALSQFFVGSITWLYMLPYGITAIFYGPLVRVIDAKKVELVCFLSFSLANLLAASASNIHTLFIARFLMGVFGASVIPLVLIMIATKGQANKRGKEVGLFFATTFIASLIGLFLSGVIYWRWLYFIPAIAGFILCGLMYFNLPNFPVSSKKFVLKYHEIFKHRETLLLFLYIFTISLLYHGINQWLGVYFSQKFSFSQFIISMLITIAGLSGVLGEILGGVLADRIGRLNIANIGIGIMIISVVILLIKLPIGILGLLMFAWGLGWTFNHVGVSTVLTDLPKDIVYEGASLNSSIRFISGGLGVILSGLIMKKSFVLGFTTLAFCLLGLLLLAKIYLKEETCLKN